MGLLVKARTATLAEATLQLRAGQRKEDDIEMEQSMLPAEWFPQSGVQLTWPHAGTDWLPWLDEMTELYIKLSYYISSVELLLIVTPEVDAVKRLLQEKLPSNCFANVRFVACPTNDTWARDHAFISVREEGHWMLKDFSFNGWGNKFPCQLDNAINQKVAAEQLLKGTYQDCLDFVLEGGSIESDGRGTLLVTAQCLLNQNRNPKLTRDEIESRLKKEFFAKRILWLFHGALEGDDTDSHIDTLARFCPNDVITYVRVQNQATLFEKETHLMEKELREFRTLEGEPYKLIPLPLPNVIVEDGEQLPATYANFLIMNELVLMPTYGQAENDALALKQLEEAFPNHSVVGIDCRVLIRQHGSLHCSTMQFPKGILN